jgi:hypothetical protein
MKLSAFVRSPTRPPSAKGLVPGGQNLLAVEHDIEAVALGVYGRCRTRPKDRG